MHPHGLCKSFFLPSHIYGFAGISRHAHGLGEVCLASAEFNLRTIQEMGLSAPGLVGGSQPGSNLLPENEVVRVIWPLELGQEGQHQQQLMCSHICTLL